MPRNVNVFFSGWIKTGTRVQFDQWRTSMTINYVDDTGAPQTWTGNVTFPNDLSLAPAEWLKEELSELIIRVARKRLGIDP